MAVVGGKSVESSHNNLEGWTDRVKLRVISPCSLSCRGEGGDIGELVLGLFTTTIALEAGLRWWIRRSAAALLRAYPRRCSAVKLRHPLFQPASSAPSSTVLVGAALWTSSDSMRHLCYSYRPRCKRGETIRQRLLAWFSFVWQVLAAERRRGLHPKW